MSERHANPGDMPLFRWGAELRRARATRRRLCAKLALGAAGIALVLITAIAKPAPRLVWNASQSAAIGLYAVDPGADPERGDTVIAWPPPTMRELAATRHYLPRNVPLVKRVAAVGGDYVCAIGEAVFVDGRLAVHRLEADAKGRPLPWWTGCTLLESDQYLLLMDGVPHSFDGRYFGTVGRDAIVGKANLLWAR